MYLKFKTINLSLNTEPICKIHTYDFVTFVVWLASFFPLFLSLEETKAYLLFINELIPCSIKRSRSFLNCIFVFIHFIARLVGISNEKISCMFALNVSA